MERTRYLLTPVNTGEFYAPKRRSQFETKFWQQAYRAVPKGMRAKYRRNFLGAERWELRADAAIEAWSRAAAAFGRLFHMPNHKPGH